LNVGEGHRADESYTINSAGFILLKQRRREEKEIEKERNKAKTM
jgi:hypothetical protein